jgi:GlpG protein
MPEIHQALSVAIEEDLLPLSVLLHERGVVHRIFEEDGRQVVMVDRQAQVQPVQLLYAAWRDGTVHIELSRQDRSQQPGVWSKQWRSAPLTLVFILCSVLGFLITYLPTAEILISYLTFTPFHLDGDQLRFENFNGQYWRFVTPVFLHFGWLHIVFNSLWLWELGRRTELVLGHFNLFMLIIAIAVVSNIIQFKFGGMGLFGGMSGVVYGLLGFSWAAPLLQPGWRIQPSSAIMLFMVGWLVACMAGIAETLGFGSIANAAHVGGLLCGAALGLVFGALSRVGGDKT